MKLGHKDGPQFKSPSTFVLVNTPEKDCKCGHYGLEDKFGYCPDEDCRRDRLVADLKAGRANMLKDGTLLWLVD